MKGSRSSKLGRILIQLSIDEMAMHRLKIVKPNDIAGMNAWCEKILENYSLDVDTLSKAHLKPGLPNKQFHQLVAHLNSIENKLSGIVGGSDFEEESESTEETDEGPKLEDINITSKSLAELRILGAAYGYTQTSRDALVRNLEALQREIRTRKGSGIVTECKRCGGHDHEDARSRKCPKNKRSKAGGA